MLVVLTEFVVLLAFGSRFYFDKKLDDLNETITQKQAQISAYSQVENDFRKYLSKQQPIESSEEYGLKFQTRITDLARRLPTGTTLDGLSIGKDGMTVTGKALSEYGFAQLLSGIKKMQDVSKVMMKDTNYDQTTGGVKFNIQIVFKNG